MPTVVLTYPGAGRGEPGHLSEPDASFLSLCVHQPGHDGQGAEGAAAVLLVCDSDPHLHGCLAAARDGGRHQEPPRTEDCRREREINGLAAWALGFHGMVPLRKEREAFSFRHGRLAYVFGVRPGAAQSRR